MGTQIAHKPSFLFFSSQTLRNDIKSLREQQAH